MKKIYKILSGLLLALGLLSPQVFAQDLNYKQVGTPSQATLGYATSYLPVYSQNKFGQAITLYKAEAIGLPAGTVIKELSFLGYQTSEKDWEGSTIEVYIGNASSDASYTDFIISGPSEGSASTTIFDTTKGVLFYSGSFSIPMAGSKEAPVELVKFNNSDGFTYTGGGIVIYTNAFTSKFNGAYTNFSECETSGTIYRANGAYRDSGYDPQKYPGYGVNTKAWSTYSYGNLTPSVPVIKLGYTGEKQTVSATISGKIVTSTSSTTGLSGATVKLTKDAEVVETITTPFSGNYSFSVEAVDEDATYAVVASKEGYETNELVVDIKAGGAFTDKNIVLTKLPVPAVLSGQVYDNATNNPLTGAVVTFNDMQVTTTDDGKYAFNIANVDDLPAEGLPLTAVCDGYIDYSRSLAVTGDMTFNIAMIPLPELPGEGTQIGVYNANDYYYTAPVNGLWKYSASEVIYPKAALEDMKEGDKFSSISFYGYLQPQTTGGNDDDDSGNDDDDWNDYWSAPSKAAANENPWKGHVTIYMINTPSSSFSTTSGTNLEDLTPLFDGEIVVNEGGSKTSPALLYTAEFNQPFEYGGDNIKLICVGFSNNSRLVYYAFDPEYNNNVLEKADSNEESFLTKAYSKMTSGVPVVKLGAYVPTAVVSGTVTDKNTGVALEGAVVTLASATDKISATTDAEGAYELIWRNVDYTTTYTLNVEKDPYSEVTLDLTFAEDDLEVTKNIELTINGTICGTVIDAVTEEGIEGLTVMVYDAEENEITLDASESTTTSDGSFYLTIPDLKYETYTVKVSGGKYNADSKEVGFSATEIDIEDVEIALTFNATVSGNVTINNTTPATGAIVTIGKLTATVDAEGAYSIEFAPVENATETVTVVYDDETAFNGSVDLTTGSEIVYDINITSGVEAVFGADVVADVYSVNGIMVARNADIETVKALPAGIYVINGKKVIVRN